MAEFLHIREADDRGGRLTVVRRALARQGIGGVGGRSAKTAAYLSAFSAEQFVLQRHYLEVEAPQKLMRCCVLSILRPTALARRTKIARIEFLGHRASSPRWRARCRRSLQAPSEWEPSGSRLAAEAAGAARVPLRAVAGRRI
jgi:hypothetical protein